MVSAVLQDPGSPQVSSKWNQSIPLQGIIKWKENVHSKLYSRRIEEMHAQFCHAHNVWLYRVYMHVPQYY